MALSKQAVAELIRRAFHDVRLDEGVGLFEGQGLDDYSDAKTLAAYRAKDERNDWSRISAEDLTNCYSSLSFFDASGMRFHLPAYLIADLEGRIRIDVLFHLVHLDEYALARFRLLSPDQRRAIREYLLLTLETVRSTSPLGLEDPLVASIDAALDHCWTE